MEGEAEGASVGLLLGEGDAEGLLEGEAEGLLEGDNDGLAEGEAEVPPIGSAQSTALSSSRIFNRRACWVVVPIALSMALMEAAVEGVGKERLAL